MHYATRCLVSLLALTCFLFFTIVPRFDLLEDKSARVRSHPARQLFPTITPTTTTAAATTNTDTATTAKPTATTPTATTPATTPATSATGATTASSSTVTSATSATSASSTGPGTSTTPPATTSAPPTTTGSASSDVVTTNSLGQTSTVIVITGPDPTSSAAASASTTSSDDDNGNGGGLGTGSIIGIALAGGVALIGIVSFFVWKFTRKRFSDFDDNEAIKWPELNSHGEASHPLPTNATGRAGFGNESEASLSRSPSGNGYAPSLATTSTPEFAHGGPDPYAVPPLPHLNPNQPYHDDPNAAAYYDPYRGPVPQTFNDAASISTHGGYGGEAIPMTQMAPGGRMRSPGPGAAYDMGRASPQPSMAGRRSPGPQMAMGYDDRARSPGPNMSLGMGQPPMGRQSPGPHAAYGYQ